MKLLLITRSDGEVASTQEMSTTIEIWDTFRSLIMGDESWVEIYDAKVVITSKRLHGQTRQAVLSGDEGEIEGYRALAWHYLSEQDDHPAEPEVMMTRAIERVVGREPFALQDYGWDEIESLFLDHFCYLE